MAISASDVKALRERSNAGMMDCKRALTDANGDMDKAAELLRERGLANADKKAGRIAAEGIVESYIHMGGKIGVLVEVNCETDFVAKTPQFKSFVRDIAMQIAATNPKYLDREAVPAADLEKEKEILMAQTMNEGKPANIAEKIVVGRIDKFYRENCLMEQEFVRDSSKTILDYQKEMTAMIGEKISVRRYVRYEMGEGLQKREEDFAAEVMKQSGK